MSPKALEAILTTSGYLPAESNGLPETHTRRELNNNVKVLSGRYLTALLWLSTALRMLQEGLGGENK